MYSQNFAMMESDILEPRLKYDRVPGGAKEITSNDSISCIFVQEKLTVLGTNWGNIHFLDLLGNKCFKSISAHSTTINQLSMDLNGEYVASCSDDGKVMVFGLCDEKKPPLISFNREIKAVAISPEFKKNCQFVTGDSRLILVSKGILKGDSHKVLQENKSLIRNIKWRKDNIVYATEDSVYVMDMREHKLIGIIEPNVNKNISKEYFCRIFWISDEKFLVGWGHLIQMFIIKDSTFSMSHLKHFESSNSSMGRMLPTNTMSKKIDSIYSFTHPDIVLGVVNYNNYILALVDPISVVVDDDSSEDHVENKKCLMVVILEPVTTNPDGYTELAAEKISVRSPGKSSEYQIYLEKPPLDNEFLIASPKGLVSVKEKDINDRVKWLVENFHFTKALTILKTPEGSSSSYTYKDVGLRYIKFLLKFNKYQEAAAKVSSICDDVPTWETVIDDFLSAGNVECLLDYIPTDEKMQLSKDVYMKILNTCFKNLKVFHSILKKWPPSIYSLKQTFNLIYKDETNQRLFSHKSTDILTAPMQQRETLVLQCLGILFEHKQEYRKALDIYLRLKSPYVFDLIPRRNLFDDLKEKLHFLINFDKEKTLELLMDYIVQIPPDTVMSILEPTPVFLFAYLEMLRSKNRPASEPYDSYLVRLYTQFQQENLMAFLRSSDKYDLNLALNLCRERNLKKEQIYLLSRMGNSEEALKMIMSQKNGAIEAIQYCQMHNDSDLWDQLTEYALDKPEYVRAILENTTVEEINLEDFLNKVLGSGTNILSLKGSLVTLLINNEERASVLQSHQTARWQDLDRLLRWGCRLPPNAKQYKTHFTMSPGCNAPIICDELHNNTGDNVRRQYQAELTNENNAMSAIVISDYGSCQLCGKSLRHCPTEIVIHSCRHFCHTACLIQRQQQQQQQQQQQRGLKVNVTVNDFTDPEYVLSVKCGVCN